MIDYCFVHLFFLQTFIESPLYIRHIVVDNYGISWKKKKDNDQHLLRVFNLVKTTRLKNKPLT